MPFPSVLLRNVASHKLVIISTYGITRLASTLLRDKSHLQGCGSMYTCFLKQRPLRPSQVAQWDQLLHAERKALFPLYEPSAGNRQETVMNDIAVQSQFPQAEGLYHPVFEHDACGVGLISNIKGE